VYVAFIVDVFSQRIVGWHAQTTKHVELVMITLRMGLGERDRQRHPIQPQQLRAHSDAGSPNMFRWRTPKNSPWMASHPRLGPSVAHTIMR
jgi:transposase InsO family protein